MLNLKLNINLNSFSIYYNKESSIGNNEISSKLKYFEPSNKKVSKSEISNEIKVSNLINSIKDNELNAIVNLEQINIEEEESYSSKLNIFKNIFSNKYSFNSKKTLSKKDNDMSRSSSNNSRNIKEPYKFTSENNTNNIFSFGNKDNNLSSHLFQKNSNNNTNNNNILDKNNIIETIKENSENEIDSLKVKKDTLNIYNDIHSNEEEHIDNFLSQMSTKNKTNKESFLTKPEIPKITLKEEKSLVNSFKKVNKKKSNSNSTINLSNSKNSYSKRYNDQKKIKISVNELAKNNDNSKNNVRNYVSNKSKKINYNLSPTIKQKNKNSITNKNLIYDKLIKNSSKGSLSKNPVPQLNKNTRIIFNSNTNIFQKTQLVGLINKNKLKNKRIDDAYEERIIENALKSSYDNNSDKYFSSKESFNRKFNLN